MADTDSPESGVLKFGYYRSINSTMSLKILAGAVLADNSRPMAQLELAWRLR